MTMVPYPPSQTERYLHCPKEWDLSRRWEPLGEWEPNALMGTALGAALDIHRLKSPNMSPYDILSSVLEKGWQPCHSWTIEAAYDLSAKVLKKAMQTMPSLLLGGSVHSVQSALGPQVDAWKHGHEGMDPSISHHSVADLIVALPDGTYMIWDDKFTLDCEAKWIPKRLEETETMVQLWEYALLAKRYHNLNVTAIGKHLMVGKPSIKSETYTVQVTPTRMDLFKDDSTEWWKDMADMDESGYYPRRWGDACLKPWRCQFYDLCHHMDGDESLAHKLYRRKP